MTEKAVLIKLRTDLVRQAKMLAAERGGTLKEVVNAALADYLANHVRPRCGCGGVIRKTPSAKEVRK